jgi:Spy/CpxP family protein refolding chaperone
MNKIISTFVIIIMMVGGLSAQNMMYGRPGGHDGPGGPMGKPGKPEECISDQPYYQYMVFRMTEILDLTPEQAEKLFPLNRPYRDAKHALHMQMNALSEDVFQKNVITRSDLEKYKDEIKRIQNEEAKLDEEFYENVETFLEPQQVAKLIFFEPHFRRELSKELKDRYMPEKKKDKKRFWQKGK